MIGAIENAIMEQVRAASDAGVLGYRFKTVASYAGEFDDDMRELAQSFPAFFIGFSHEADPERVGSHEYKYRPVFRAVVAARSLRNEKATRHGAAGEIGSYQLLIDARALLIGQTLGLDIEDLVPGASAVLINGTRRSPDSRGSKPAGERMSVIGFELSTAYVAEPRQPTDLADFTTFHADWDIPPHEGHDAVPLAAGEADATDKVTLES